MLVISFYTIDTPYEQEIKKLEANLNELGLPHYFKGYESRGSWVQNCAIKPEFILHCLEQFPDEESILYVDCDAKLHSIPDPSFEDIGVHYKDGVKLLSGTIFLRNNKRVHTLICAWVKCQQINNTRWDQKILQETIACDSKIRVTRIPPQYTQIFDTMAKFGKPVIEHFQASRRYKGMINQQRIVGGMRVRTNPDGSITLPRSNKTAIAILEKEYIKNKNENTWYPKGSVTPDFIELLDMFKDKVVYIVGKGPSLDNLSKDNFEPDALIICINESIRKIESLNLSNQLFMLQYDTRLRGTCHPNNTETILLLNRSICAWYSNHEKKYKYSNLNITGPVISATCAIMICKTLEVSLIRLIAFDACTNGDTGYAKVVGYSSKVNGDPKRFLKHKVQIEKALSGLEYSWEATEAPSIEASYIPQPLPLHLEEHHDDHLKQLVNESLTNEENI